ncbi:hypothetical protein CEXT_539571 [Caerostris extrusa]|uniref:Uncharacterized protein n=1 Tax=Caerostris extrusa TaxID=172846 RepID=A0AAV4TE08_CAEEX|nr:hypothetical protein CEXT_539571 [Caerostris extrusa]
MFRWGPNPYLMAFGSENIHVHVDAESGWQLRNPAKMDRAGYSSAGDDESPGENPLPIPRLRLPYPSSVGIPSEDKRSPSHFTSLHHPPPLPPPPKDRCRGETKEETIREYYFRRYFCSSLCLSPCVSGEEDLSEGFSIRQSSGDKTFAQAGLTMKNPCCN